MNEDLEHLRLLSIFHYVVAGVLALFSCLPFIHFFMGVAMVSGWGEIGADPEAGWVGWLLIGIASFFILLGWGFAVCLVMAGRNLTRHRRYTFCLVVAALSCLFMPIGTALGIFTIIVLMRPSVRELFEDRAPAPPPAVPVQGTGI